MASARVPNLLVCATLAALLGLGGCVTSEKLTEEQKQEVEKSREELLKQQEQYERDVERERIERQATPQVQ